MKPDPVHMKLDFTSDINREYVAAMHYPEVDRFIVRIHWWSLFSLAALAFVSAVLKIANYYPSPLSWRVITPAAGIATVALGLCAALVPTMLRGRFRNHYLWRVLVTFTLSTFCYLFVFVAGGSIEMHFLFFVMIALMAVYSDWRLGWLTLVLVIAHHSVLNFTEPTWVFFYGRNDFALIAHALPVVVAALFTTGLCENNRKSVADLQALAQGLETAVAERTRDLRVAKEGLQEEVKSRTLELRSKLEEVERLNKTMIGRELKMVELKDEISKLSKKEK